MEVVNRPESGQDNAGENVRKVEVALPSADGGSPPSPPIPPISTAKKKYPRPKRKGFALFMGRFAFVITATMFIVMIIFSAFQIWVASNEPLLQPNVIDDILHQDKVYVQIEGENFFRELVMVKDQPVDPTQAEVTQIPAGKSFKLVFTPKQADAPENYKIYYKHGDLAGQSPTNPLDRTIRYDKVNSFYVVTVFPKAGAWSEGYYEIETPDSGMYGGKYYSYLTVGSSEPSKK